MTEQDVYFREILSFVGPLQFDRGSLLIVTASILVMVLFVGVAFGTGIE